MTAPVSTRCAICATQSAGADVIVTVAPRFDVIRGTTTPNGMFRVVVDSGAGDFLMLIRMYTREIEICELDLPAQVKWQA